MSSLRKWNSKFIKVVEKRENTGIRCLRVISFETSYYCCTGHFTFFPIKNNEMYNFCESSFEVINNSCIDDQLFFLVISFAWGSQAVADKSANRVTSMSNSNRHANCSRYKVKALCQNVPRLRIRLLSIQLRYLYKFIRYCCYS